MKVGYGSTLSRSCPSGTNFFGPCIGQQCPGTCPPTCSCFGTSPNDACCTTSSLGSRGPVVGFCRDRAINCERFRSYCTATLYIACMARHCPSTCGFCALRELNGPSAGLLNNFGLGGNSSVLANLLGLSLTQGVNVPGLRLREEAVSAADDITSSLRNYLLRMIG